MCLHHSLFRRESFKITVYTVSYDPSARNNSSNLRRANIGRDCERTAVAADDASRPSPSHQSGQNEMNQTVRSFIALTFLVPLE